MSLSVGHNQIWGELVEALGLEHVRSLKIEVSVDSIATITVEQFITEDQAGRMVPIMKKFYLVEKKPDAAKS